MDNIEYINNLLNTIKIDITKDINTYSRDRLLTIYRDNKLNLITDIKDNIALAIRNKDNSLTTTIEDYIKYSIKIRVILSTNIDTSIIDIIRLTSSIVRSHKANHFKPIVNIDYLVNKIHYRLTNSTIDSFGYYDVKLLLYNLLYITSINEINT
jgi:hypothetical protein